MAFREINFSGRGLTIHKAIVDPLFNEPTILVEDSWIYIDLWLKREKHEKARSYWEQAHNFFSASKNLPKESSPLTSYYCMLNAAKALLLVKKAAAADEHGVFGGRIGKRTSISNEEVNFKSGGILGGLCLYLGESVAPKTYRLHHLLYNLTYTHRAFNLSFPSLPELFIAVREPKIVRSNTNDEAWFCAQLTDKNSLSATIKKLGKQFELDAGVPDSMIVRSKKRFNWNSRKKEQSIKTYREYHQVLRGRLAYIYGTQRLWYLKRDGVTNGLIDRSSITLAFAAMHRLSELSRYAPHTLASHFEGRYNWLLSEFISVSPTQFIDSISSEMTGYEFMPPWRANN